MSPRSRATENTLSLPPLDSGAGAWVDPQKTIRIDVDPGTGGDFGVLEDHAPVMSTIRDGALTIQRSQGAAAEIRGGFAEVNDRGLTVLAEQAG